MRPIELAQRAVRRKLLDWDHRTKPLGTANAPPRMPPCVKAKKMGGHNKAARWLRRSCGWWTTCDIAKVFGISKSTVMRHIRSGRIPYLEVGSGRWWVSPLDIRRWFPIIAESGRVAAWRTMGRPHIYPPVKACRRVAFVRMGRPDFELLVMSKGYTFKRLADEAGLSVRAVYALRHRVFRRGPNQTTVEAIARVLGEPEKVVREMLSEPPVTAPVTEPAAT